MVTGDITQIDLPGGRTSGLVEAMEVVGKVEGIAFVYFDERDVVRHKLVQAIVKAYDAYGERPVCALASRPRPDSRRPARSDVSIARPTAQACDARPGAVARELAPAQRDGRSSASRSCPIAACAR